MGIKNILPMFLATFILVSCSSNDEVKNDNNIKNNNIIINDSKADYTFADATEPVNANTITTEIYDLSYYLDNSIEFMYVNDSQYKYLNLSTNEFVSISFSNAKYYSGDTCIEQVECFKDGDKFKVYYEVILRTYPEIIIALYIFVD